MKNRYELEQEIAILNKEKLHYFNKCQELEERKCETCKHIYQGECEAINDWDCHNDEPANWSPPNDFSCNLWSKRDD